jgi:YD repeat-containing protein
MASLQSWFHRARIPVATAALLSWALPTIANDSVVYGYDPDGRLASALYDSGLCIAYTYDENGNRTSQSPLTAPANPTWGSTAWGCFRWAAP